MLDLRTRAAILHLHGEGHGTRFIARTVGVSRKSVQRVLSQGTEEVPEIERGEQLSAHLDRVRALHQRCRGNLVRVHEELAAEGIDVAYSTLTRFCRHHHIGYEPPTRAGRYVFLPGQEMQHDTSPHRVEVGDRTQTLQCASLVMCYSRMRFIQCYPRFTRFHVRAFLTAALRFFGGAAGRCMIDNSTVIIASGTGKEARPAPEMAAFSQHFHFTFVAHAVGDANRSGRVERPFHHVEHNFYPGRTFTDLADLNAQLLAWCEDYNHSPHRHLPARPIELFAAEKAALQPLPAWVPEPYEVHVRKVDVEGYVTLHTNRYSAPEALIGRQVEVHETLEQVQLFDGHRRLCVHARRDEGLGLRLTLPEHRRRAQRKVPLPPSPEESLLRTADPVLAVLCDALRTRHGGQALRAIRGLHRIWLEYPTDAVVQSVRRAIEFGLLDLDRIERMVLQNVHGDFFRLPHPPRPDNADG